MKKLWLCLSAIAVVNFAAAGTVKLAPGPFEMTDRIGPMKLEGEPHKYQDPRLGQSYQYYGGGLSLTVYVFDAGFTDVPDGGDSIPTCQAFEAAKQDLAHAGYANVTLKSEQLARLDGAADFPLMREALYEYVREGHPTLSYVWITGAAKQFVKLRFSVDPKLRDELLDARRAILEAVGEAIKPHLAPLDPKAREQTTHVVINSAGDTDEKGLALMYLMSIAASVDKNPGVAPICGGQLVPDFAGEVHAFGDVLTVAKESGATKFSKRLGEIASAGFLEEFVWTYRHRAEWGATLPAGLDLQEFNGWRKKKLKRFKVPDFGYVEVSHPRPMTVEPAP